MNKIERKKKKTSPTGDQAMMRLDSVAACIDHVTYMWRRIDKLTGKTTE